ncbi:GNAT family N-acetyltransferase [Paragemmobacter straminiformis]|uniref:GNAT family N-acetyltransferase n=1 Tax=Paragemmobacter straminiformis TaxID=2045119 RepID=UPI003BAEBE7A
MSGAVALARRFGVSPCHRPEAGAGGDDRDSGDRRQSGLDGLFLDPAHWGRGYATEALSAFLALVMPRFGLTSIEAGHFGDNPASGAVLRKVGFVETGREAGSSAARLEAAPIVNYRLDLTLLKA